MKMVRNWLRLARLVMRLPISLARLFIAVCRYQPGTVSDNTAYSAMLDAFSISGGLTNDLVSHMLRHPPQQFSRVGLLDSLSGASAVDLVEELRHKGYVVFPGLLDEATCDKLTNFALSIPGEARGIDEGDVQQPLSGLYQRLNPTSVIFQYDMSLVTESVIVQRLLTDNSLLALVQDYLGGAPIVDIITLWWSTAYKAVPDKNSAQYWHFDMDRPKWLKVFFYLTEVGPENGPHSFIEGTHRNGGIPLSLRSKGYTRLTDEEIELHFSAERIREFTGSRGTVIIEDTRGLHKGKHLTVGDRLILQFEYCSSLFGGTWSHIRTPKAPEQSFVRQRTETPVLFQAFD